MVDSVSFRTRARTIDHLGREQIADCPTAISELWKNAYDAYATSVGLHIYDDPLPVAAIVDDGHGMNRSEFIEKWLVIGTESKVSGESPADMDRNGLPLRARQGQKGIGRLSSAFLGPLLLVVSRRQEQRVVAALIDWRLFENPFLYLQDIEIPVVEFDRPEEIFGLLPIMADELRGNLCGNRKDAARDDRIARAWKQFEALEATEGKPSTRTAMERILDVATFEPRHFQQWPLWRNEKAHGTILLIVDVVFDLEAQIPGRVSREDAEAATQAKDRLFQTLCNFVDPFSDQAEVAEGYGAQDFDYSVTAWEGSSLRSIISSERQFDYRNLEELEHVVDGRVNEQGIFAGRVKAFGRWLPDEVQIRPTAEVSGRSNSKVGPFHIRLGTFQQVSMASSHPPEVHQHLMEQAGKYAGVMVFRNGLRVMPYGREDNDFFEIEKRRSLHAGRAFWSNRRTFGRVAITRHGNPNLKDKAGREGLIDNKAAKVFRDLVENILKKTGLQYFGTDSDLQKEFLPEIKQARAREKVEHERDKQRAAGRRRFRTDLRRLGPQMAVLLDELEVLTAQVGDLQATSESAVLDFRRRLSELRGCASGLSLGDPPSNLGPSADEYAQYRFRRRRVDELLKSLEQMLNVALEKIRPRAPREIILSDLKRHTGFLQNRLSKWRREAGELIDAEQRRLATLYEQRSKHFQAVTLHLLDDVEYGRISLRAALERLAVEREKADLENAEAFEPHIAALRSLQENIDLVNLATYGIDAVDEMREELDRLHSLAQLGITVEIIGHEIEGFERTISEGLNQLPEAIRDGPVFAAVQTAHTALSDRLRFLSPLKLSGPKFRTLLNGNDILSYVRRFFGTSLDSEGVALNASDRFLSFSVYEQPSRIFPVFINLINNAAYWVCRQASVDRQILLDAVGERIVVADSGPGVDQDDLRHLFSLFFTRKVRGGRGVGLYLCRTNLAAGGHTIQYATDDRFRLLPGANFVIDFKGATYG